MPQVGSRHYSYTPKGQMAAKKAAKKTGKKIVNRMPKKKKSMLA